MNKYGIGDYKYIKNINKEIEIRRNRINNIIEISCDEEEECNIRSYMHGI